jgi:hypothetical protein
MSPGKKSSSAEPFKPEQMFETNNQPSAEQVELCTMRGIRKSFDGNAVLKDVDFELCAGEVHALVGENGAGKTTLMNILAGVHQPDSGSIRLRGRAQVTIPDEKSAQELGIGIVFQERSLFAQFFFRQFYYLGSNPKAAHLSGMNVEGLQIFSFVLMGLLAGLAGILYASRIATATSTVGVGAELQAITAVILGGASLAGGRGTIWGAMIGVFFMGLMKNVLIISRFSSEWQGIVLGGVLVIAVAIDSIVNRKRVS